MIVQRADRLVLLPPSQAVPAGGRVRPANDYTPGGHDGASWMFARVGVVEFVGPAGAGKTSLIDALRERDPALHAPIRISQRRHLAPAALQALHLVPMLIRESTRASGCAWRDARYLLELNTLRDAVESAARCEDRPILLDEGPAYVVARAVAFRPADPKATALDVAWARGIRQWGRVLDTIIWLDAPDEVLAERIRAREKPHRVKEAGDPEVREFLAKYRRAYEWVIDQFAAAGRTRLFRFDTSKLTVDGLADAATRVIEGVTRA